MTKKVSANGLKFVDVFAGCGGLSLGLKRAGWECLMAIEKDQHAFQTYRTNLLEGAGPSAIASWPKGVAIKPWEIASFRQECASFLDNARGRVDLLAGGPPCQGFSHAGRRQVNDPRNSLFLDYLSLVSDLMPKAVLIENVKGFTADFGGGLPGAGRNFASELRERLDVDYIIADTILMASDFGVPQARPRFFLIGVRRDLEASGQVSTFFDQLRAGSPAFLAKRGLMPGTTARDALSDLEVAVAGKVPCPETSGYLAIAHRGPRTPYQRAMNEEHAETLSDTRLAKHAPEIVARFADIIRNCAEDGRLNRAISKELRERHGLRKMALRVLDPLSPAPTITSMPDDLLHYQEPRTLTVRENARLQSFPDWFQFKGKFTTGGLARRREIPRYTQVANAVPPLLAEQIGANLSGLLGGG
ncbi:DNA cytosine methyltransferase [Candidatus Phyllobacterium onerii]|uniref:DNA cytosine methyltransferase n=1 Tax=Candidatus Phyllobacterium onerii TaxID=3020828 RepID=UPI00232D3517|nr:DNA cytosine methyltransferase [Phyllobacterium sp. IY22]